MHKLSTITAANWLLSIYAALPQIARTKRSLLIFLMLILGNLANAATSVPDALQPWQNWVLEKHPEASCPYFDKEDQRPCTWYGRLNISADASKLVFEQSVTLYANKNWVELPGDLQFWPSEVTIQKNGKAPQKAVISRRSNRPAINLAQGTWQIRGMIEWTAMPNSIRLPPTTGLVNLTINNDEIQPYLDSSQQLWLRKAQESNQAANTLSIQVYRHLNDTIPALLTTFIDLDIAGTEREENLGRVLPEGFVAQSVRGPLDPQIVNGELHLQARPGNWHIEIAARYNQPLKHLSAIQPFTSAWPNQEVWAFEAQPQLRVVNIAGAPSVDPQQYHLPNHLQHFSAYLISAGTSLTFNEQPPRTDNNNDSQWQIQRQLWLDFSGNSYTYRDQLKELNGDSRRINSQPPYQLGRVTENGLPRVITTIAGKDGIELRTAQSHLVAEGTLVNSFSLPAAGWQTDVSQLGININLPPAWSLLAARGADKVINSWVSNWNLWSLFLVLIISLAVRKIMNLKWALITLATLLFSYQRPESPVFIWLNLAAVFALLPLTKGKAYSWLQRYQLASIAALLLILLPFSVVQLQQAIYPQLELRYSNQNQSYERSLTEAGQLDAAKAAMESRERIAPTTLQPLMSSKDTVLEQFSAPKKSISQKQTYPSQNKLGENLRQVQTGPGVPEWQWKQANLQWNGPVTEKESIQLYLASPIMNRTGNVISVMLCWLLAWQFIRQTKLKMPSSKLSSKWLTPSVTAILLPVIVFNSLTLSTNTNADVLIDSALLSELEQRLTQPPACAPTCVQLQRVDVTLNQDTATLNLQLHAQALSAFQLPSSTTWLPNNAQLDGQPATLHRLTGTELWIDIPTGRHSVTLKGSLKNLNEADWNFHSPTSNTYVHSTTWSHSGLDGLFLRNGNLVAKRLQPDEKKEGRKKSQLDTFVRVERQLFLGKDWRMTTRILRVAPTNAPINLQLPLLNGEQITTADVTVKDQKALVKFTPSQQQVSWTSVLTDNSSVKFIATNTPLWTEKWFIDHDENWHISYKGIEPIQAVSTQGPVNKRRYQWQPWHGESLTVNAFQPPAKDGSDLTLVNVDINHNLGQRLTETQLIATVRSSIGQQLTWQLNEDLTLQHLKINGLEQPLPDLQNGAISFSISPGEQRISLEWKQSKPITMLRHADPINLGQMANNIRQTIQIPKDRWILAVGGPTIGPALLIWGAVLVIVCIAAVLGRIKLTPLTTMSWLLLGLGLSTTQLLIPLLVVACLFALAWRGQQSELPNAGNFKLIQVCLCLLCLISIGALILSVPYSLLSTPDMLIVGNGSNTYQLNWYQDHSVASLPQPWVFSLPMWAYKLLMLAWSIWLANALLRWLPWGWKQLNHLGFWPQKPEQN